MPCLQRTALRLTIMSGYRSFLSHQTICGLARHVVAQRHLFILHTSCLIMMD